MRDWKVVAERVIFLLVVVVLVCIMTERQHSLVALSILFPFSLLSSNGGCYGA